jgi:mono/diheme cytochrome c family protein
VGIEQTTSLALDKMFAAAKALPVGPGVSAAQILGLPEHLRDTDLFTLDSATLAQYGVVAFAPAYPLWSDNAAKLRHIRIPRGTSIAFNKATQTWTIPPNTRFYKTFMKPIVDIDGSERYKKVETRLIVARPDTVNADGTKTPTAIFGSYKWTDDESDAILVQTPLNSGVPFADTVIQYTTDEPLAADILKGAPLDPDEALLENGAARHYAIPSSQRCMQCHMGSATGTFSLGFLPLQINRHPTGESGVIEPAGPDELTQLQRFIDYGIITGMDSPNDVLALEQSEGTRKPRNGYELMAQGYMLGNCSHCHNPNGYPSQIAPVLATVLNFLPTPTSGVFQLPLELSSPRIFRGTIGQTLIPYLTPSLMDLPRFDLNNAPLQDPFIATAQAPDGSQYIQKAMFAPWRSLIYRNVDNPFAYTDDLALFPHMPMNTPGYDPRAKQIMSQWMVSIPAVRKNPEIPEYAFHSSTNGIFGGGATVDTNPQPYIEVFPGDPRYDLALAAANRRVNLLMSGVAPPLADAGAEGGADTSSPQSLVPTGPTTVAYSRYADPGETEDILDPQVLADPVCHPVPTPPPSGDTALPYPTTTAIPAHPDWVITDSTQPPGVWSPRRPDWATVLIDNAAADGGADKANGAQCGVTAESVAAAAMDEQAAITLVQNIPPLATVRDTLTAEIPFGLWQVEPGCDFSKQPTGDSFTGASRPIWMDVAGVTNEPVYSQTAGEAVFKMICINCHGVKADSNGRLAQNLATMTGGLAEVADFRDGLFGPVGTADGNIDRVFGGAGLPEGAWTAPGITPDDRASRYMAWMALGGTKVRIPDGILEIVSLTKVLDKPRLAAPAGQHISANMLSTVKALCTSLLGCSDPREVCSPFNPANPVQYSASLIHTNGDAELWLKLCSLNNPPPIHVLDRQGFPGVDRPFDPSSGEFLFSPNNLYEPSSYKGPVGGDRATWPWCEYPSNTPVSGVPYCQGGTDFTAADAENWAVRGAINAGLAVFLYVKSLETMNPPPDYNQCEQLP